MTNNEAERALRHCVILRRISYGTKTQQGSRIFAVLASVIETCRLRGRSPCLFGNRYRCRAGRLAGTRFACCCIGGVNTYPGCATLQPRYELGFFDKGLDNYDFFVSLEANIWHPVIYIEFTNSALRFQNTSTLLLRKIMISGVHKSINVKELTSLAKESIETCRGIKLSFIQKIILKETLSDQTKTYSQIAQENHYSDKYIKQVVAPKLWQLFSEALGVKVTKHNCRLVLGSLLDKPSLPHPSFLDEPLQKATLEPLEGQVPLDSPFYIQQDLSLDPYQEILKEGTLLRIIAPSKRGKTSLMARILHYGQMQSYHTVRLSLLRAGTNIFNSEEKFMRWFCASVTQQLQLESKLDDYCNEDMGSLLNCTLYFQDYLLAEINCPLILAIDEINQLFEYPELARNFLSLLGSWHQETKDIAVWQKLRLIIVHTTDLDIPLALNKSLFNVGLVIELPTFTQEEVIDLANRCGLKLLDSELEGLMELTGGFPYLLRLLFDHMDY